MEILRQDVKKVELGARIKEVMADKFIEGSVEEEWQFFHERLTQIAKEVVGIKKIGGTKKRTPFWTQELKDAIRQKTTAFRKWIKSRTADTRRD